MIKNFSHKGLKKLYETGITIGVHSAHIKRLRLILARLESIQKPADMNLPGLDFHGLKGTRKDQFSVCVNKNWRVVFKWNGVDTYDVDYIDYH